MKMKIKEQSFVGIALIVILLSALLEYYYGGMNAGDLFVGTATLVLAFATISLVWAEIDASKKERTRDHLKERLQELYSPLMGLGDDFEKPIEHVRDSTGAVYPAMMKIRSAYNYLASNALKELLDNYYKIHYALINQPDSNILKNIRVIYESDFIEITKKYRRLTISEIDEKHVVGFSEVKSKMINSHSRKVPRPVAIFFKWAFLIMFLVITEEIVEFIKKSANPYDVVGSLTQLGLTFFWAICLTIGTLFASWILKKSGSDSFIEKILNAVFGE